MRREQIEDREWGFYIEGLLDMKEGKPTKSELDELEKELDETKKKLRNPYFTTEEIKSLQIEEVKIEEKIKEVSEEMKFFMAD